MILPDQLILLSIGHGWAIAFVVIESDLAELSPTVVPLWDFIRLYHIVVLVGSELAARGIIVTFVPSKGANRVSSWTFPTLLLHLDGASLSSLNVLTDAFIVEQSSILIGYPTGEISLLGDSLRRYLLQVTTPTSDPLLLQLLHSYRRFLRAKVAWWKVVFLSTTSTGGPLDIVQIAITVTSLEKIYRRLQIQWTCIQGGQIICH